MARGSGGCVPRRAEIDWASDGFEGEEARTPPRPPHPSPSTAQRDRWHIKAERVFSPSTCRRFSIGELAERVWRRTEKRGVSMSPSEKSCAVLRWLCVVTTVSALCGCGGAAMLPSATGLPDVHEELVADSEASHRLEEVWTSNGNWVDVDRDTTTGEIYGLRSIRGDRATQSWTGEVCQLDSTGAMVKAVTVGGSTHPPNWLRVLRDDTNGTVAFATGLLWRPTVHVYEADGSLLWSKQYHGVSSLRAGDIDGDGVDELLVATMNGLFAERLNGSTQWHALGNRHAADVAHLRDVVLVQVSSNRIVAVSTDGVINQERRARSQYQVVVLLPSENGRDTAMGVAIPEVDVISADATIQRRLTIRGYRLANRIVSDAAVSPDGKWLAVICKEGSVAVIDVASDRVVSVSQLDVHLYPKLEWMPCKDGDSCHLVVASARGMRAYAMRPALQDAKPRSSGSSNDGLGNAGE